MKGRVEEKAKGSSSVGEIRPQSSICGRGMYRAGVEIRLWNKVAGVESDQVEGSFWLLHHDGHADPVCEVLVIATGGRVHSKIWVQLASVYKMRSNSGRHGRDCACPRAAEPPRMRRMTRSRLYRVAVDRCFDMSASILMSLALHHRGLSGLAICKLVPYW